MTSAQGVAPTTQILKWVGVGLIGGIILGLLASLLIRPPVDTRTGLVVTPSVTGEINSVFLGGSLTDGRYATAEDLAFRSLVAEGLPVEVTTSRGELSGSSLADALLTTVIPDDANLVVIELGSTDVYEGGATPVQLGLAYAELLDRVTSASPGVAVVCLGVWGRAGLAEVFDDEISARCVDIGGVFVPLSDLYDTPGLRGPAGVETYLGPSDDFHPNDEAHAEIADRILRSVRVED